MIEKMRKKIGRTLPPSIYDDELDGSKTFKLKSGAEADFTLIKIPNKDLKDKTYVKFEINGRSQDQLSERTLRDISTLKHTQYFPAIAIKEKDGRYNFLDGSRRRAGGILWGVDLEVLVTEDHIEVSDAKQLAKDIQSARELNLRDVGLRLKEIKKITKCSNKELAKQEGISETKVSRALMAAKVSNELISFFDAGELTLPDYKFLMKVQKQLQKENVVLKDFCDSLGFRKITENEKYTPCIQYFPRLDYIRYPEYINSVEYIYSANFVFTPQCCPYPNYLSCFPSRISYLDEAKDTIIIAIKKKLLNKKEEGLKTESKTIKLFSKNKYVKRKTKGSNVQFEFRLISNDILEKVEAEISRILKEAE